MSSRRTLILIVAVAIGAIASFSLFRYVNNYTSEVDRDSERIAVYVVKKDIPQGLTGEEAIQEKYLDESKMPREFTPTTAITDVEQVRTLVSLTALPAGQVLSDGMFVAPEVANTTNAQRLKPNDRVAVTISVDQVRGVAGLIVPGDRVNMMIGVNDEPGVSAGEEGVTEPGTLKFGWGEIDRAMLLYQNVEVLFVGQTAAPQPGDTAPAEAASPTGGLLTLSVPQEAALRIAAVGGEAIYLTLVPPDYSPTEIPPVTADNIFDVDLTPYNDDEL